MNYYPFHVGDYWSHTTFLTPMQDLAYRRLLDLYYTREQPLPPDPLRCARIANLSAHLDDVQAVLEEFFVLEEDGYRNKRCDEILEKFISQREKAQRAGIESGKARRALAERREEGRRAVAEPAMNPATTTDQPSVNECSTGIERPLNGCSTNVEPTNNQKPITKIKTPLTPLVETVAPEGFGSDPPAGVPEECPPDSPGAMTGLPAARRRRRRVADPACWAGVMTDRPPDVPDDLWRDFCALRKARNAPVTARALDGVRREAGKAGADMAQALSFMVERGHQGFIAQAWHRQQGRGIGPPARGGCARLQPDLVANYDEGVTEDGRVF
ncbi:MAG: DUF1376 domain-containing protein [Lautropia sp.]|nr:DUF1376 domain-containing protein [Lautropia sp.]